MINVNYELVPWSSNVYFVIRLDLKKYNELINEDSDIETPYVYIENFTFSETGYYDIYKFSDNPTDPNVLKIYNFHDAMQIINLLKIAYRLSGYDISASNVKSLHPLCDSIDICVVMTFDDYCISLI